MLLINNFAEFLETTPIPSKDEVIKMLTLKQNQPPEHKIPDALEQSKFYSKSVNVKSVSKSIWKYRGLYSNITNGLSFNNVFSLHNYNEY